MKEPKPYLNKPLDFKDTAALEGAMRLLEMDITSKSKLQPPPFKAQTPGLSPSTTPEAAHPGKKASTTNAVKPIANAKGVKSKVAKQKATKPKLVKPKVGTPKLVKPKVGKPKVGTPKIGTPKIVKRKVVKSIKTINQKDMTKEWVSADKTVRHNSRAWTDLLRDHNLQSLKFDQRDGIYLNAGEHIVSTKLYSLLPLPIMTIKCIGWIRRFFGSTRSAIDHSNSSLISHFGEVITFGR